MIIKIFKAMRSLENKRRHGSSQSLAYGIFGLFLPTALVVLAAMVFEKLFFRLPAEVLFSIIFLACIGSAILLWRNDDGE